MERETQRPGAEQAGSQRGEHEERESVRRALEEWTREEKRQGSGSTPTEDVLQRALDLDDVVEWHAGEDAGEVPERDE